jgi:hypothetical protein
MFCSPSIYYHFSKYCQTIFIVHKKYLTIGDHTEILAHTLITLGAVAHPMAWALVPRLSQTPVTHH